MGLFGTITGIVSGLVTKKKKWAGLGWERYVQVWKEGRSSPPSYVLKVLKNKSITIKEQQQCVAWIKKKLTGWRQDLRDDISTHFKNYTNIEVKKPEPKPKPVEVHKVSASYSPEAVTMQAIAGIPKMAIYIGLGIVGLIGVLLLSKSFRGRSK